MESHLQFVPRSLKLSRHRDQRKLDIAPRSVGYFVRLIDSMTTASTGVLTNSRVS